MTASSWWSAPQVPALDGDATTPEPILAGSAGLACSGRRCAAQAVPEPDLATLLPHAGCDPGVFAAVYRLAREPVFTTALAQVCNRSMAEEITQEVFLEVWSGAGSSFDPFRGSALAWLLLIARRRAIDRIRAEQVQRRQQLTAGFRELAHRVDDPAEIVAERTEHDHLRGTLTLLTSAQRDLLELVYLSDFSYRQVADALGLPVGTLKSRVRALRILLQRQPECHRNDVAIRSET